MTTIDNFRCNKMPALVTLFSLVFFISLCSSVLAGPGIWTSTGPDGGQAVGLVASPSTPNTFYSVSRGGVFKSIDGGFNWAASSVGITRQLGVTILHSQTAPNTLYVFGRFNVYFSNNGAASWNDRTPPGMMTNSGIITATLSRIFPGRIYLGLADGSVLRSDDAGLTWFATSPLPVSDISVTAMAAHPTDPNVLLVAAQSLISTDIHLYRGSAAGGVWTEITCPGVCPWGTSVLADIAFAGSSGKTWAVNFNGVYQSLDFGSTWVTTPTLPVNATGGQFLAPNPDDNDDLFVGGRLGLAFTQDNGTTWTEVLNGFVGNSSGHIGMSQQVVYDPFNTTIQLAGSLGNGVYRRVSPAMEIWTPNVSGMNAANIRAIAIATSSRIHAAIGDLFEPTFSAFRSTTGGSSWTATNTGLEADHFRDISVDPNNNLIVYASGRFLPHQDDMFGFNPGNGGIYKSSDGGVSWTTIDNGIPLNPGIFNNTVFGTVRTITLDQFSGSGGGSGPIQTLFVGGTGRFTDDGMGGFTQNAGRIYKSTDAGANWVIMDNGLGNAELGGSGRPLWASVVQIVQDPSDVTGATFYAATFIGGTDGSIPLSIPNGVFKTTDGGANWIPRSNGLPPLDGIAGSTQTNVLSLALDPTDLTGNTLYASTNDFSNGFVGTAYKTTDGGLNWFFSGTGLMDRDVRDLIVEPTTGDVYAAVTDPLSNGDGGVSRSTDGGASWQSISIGFPATAVATKLALDNTGANLIIHAGTTRSVQSFEMLPDMDTDGVPDLSEDNSPNGGDGNLDGMQDSDQNNVSSAPINNTNLGLSEYVTAVVTAQIGNCASLENVTGLDTVGSIPLETTYNLPFNGIQLRIPDCQSATIDLIYHDRSFEDSTEIRTYALEFPDELRFVWQQLPGSTVIGNTWSFNLNDGQLGDSTPDDNVILFLGGPAVLSEVFFSDGMEVE